MNKPTSAEIATIAATLMLRNKSLSEIEAVEAAHKLITLAESTPSHEASANQHIHPKIVFQYSGDNWRKRTLTRIETLFACNIPGDGKTPHGVATITRIERKGWKSAEEFLDYHEGRGIDPRDAAAITDLIRRWKKHQASIGPKKRKTANALSRKI